MTPQKIDERAVRVGLFVGKNVMHPMHGHPLGRGILQGTLREQGKAMLEPLGHREAAVGQQPMVTQRDSQAIERNAEHSQSESRPAKEPGDKRGQSRQMDRRDRDDVKPDHAVKTDGGRKRQASGNLASAGRRAGRNGLPYHRRRRAEVAHVSSIPSIRRVLVPTAVASAEAGDWSRTSRNECRDGRHEVQGYYRPTPPVSSPNVARLRLVTMGNALLLVRMSAESPLERQARRPGPLENAPVGSHRPNQSGFLVDWTGKADRMKGVYRLRKLN